LIHLIAVPYNAHQAKQKPEALTWVLRSSCSPAETALERYVHDQAKTRVMLSNLLMA
jgi:hypothetical protein